MNGTAPHDEPSRFNLSAWAVRHPALVLFLIIALAAGGTWSYLRMGRAEDPSFTIKALTVTAIWPGATAREMQEQVADRLEVKLLEVPHQDKVETYTRPGFVAITMQLEDKTPPKEVKDLFYQVRKKLGDIRHTLPDGVRGPFVNDEFGDVYAAVYAVTGDGIPNAELVRQAESVRGRLLSVPNVDKVDLLGEEPQRITVEFSHAKLATLGIPPQALFDSLGKQNAVTPTGSIDTASERVAVRVDGSLDGAAAVEAVPVAANGKVFRLGDIASVTRGYADPPSYRIRQDGQPAVMLAVSMTKRANGLALGADLDKAEADIARLLPVGVDLKQISDQPAVIAEAVDSFLLKFVAALAIVLLVSFASLGWRTGIVVALSVPLTLAATFLVMDAAGMEFDRISLGALILALGLLVDDAIIAIEMMVVKLEQGWDKFRAATFAWTSTAFPMLTGTLLTVVGFLPVGFANSTAGEYAGGIFWVVGIALMLSWVVAVVFTPYLGTKLLPDSMAKHGAGHGHDALYDTPMYRKLRAAVAWCVEHRKKVVIATALLFIVSVAGMGFVSKQFFPQSSRPELLVELNLRGGASFQAAEEASRKVEKLLEGDPDVRWHTTYMGAGGPRFFLSLNPALPNDSFAITVVMTQGAEARERLRARLVKAFEEEAIPEARVRVKRLDFGPPVAFPVSFRIIGPDAAEARRVAEQVRDVVRANPNTHGVHLNWGEKAPTVRLVVDQDRARLLGLAPADIAQAMQTLLSGAPITQIRDGIELVEVVARAVPAERLNLAALEDLTIPTASGRAIPLSQVATLKYEQEEPITWRRNREPVVSVNADIVDGVQAPDVTKQILPLLKPVMDSLPAGYRIETAGAVEESGKANGALYAVFPVMILVMLTLLMVQLQSFGKTALVFLTAPLGLVGAVAALLLTNSPFGFVALLGLIALAGMIMRNTLILVDQIDVDLAAGASLREAIVESTVRRARPVVLTALAAILAFVPLSFNVFWGPMAITMMGGLTIATILTLLFLPALYALWFRVGRAETATSAPAAPAPGLKVAAE